jgi:F0F1-type ATP synthase delta subunit
LLEHRQDKQIDLLQRDIAAEFARVQQHVYVEVTAAHPLEQTARDQLNRYIHIHTNAKEVELDEHTDVELLAGVIIRTAAQEELDTSARTKLKQLASLNVNTPGGL